MKRIVIVASCLLGVAVAADWYWLNPLPTANNLTSVWFTGDTGYISGGSTFRTTDNGAMWTVVAPYEFEEVRFPVDASVGYGTGYGIRKTTDAGATWTYVQVGDHGYTHEVCFPAGNDTGYATFNTDPPRLARTSDGFATHTEMFLNGVSRTNGMVFTDTRHGWIVGGSGGLYGGFILRTTDGGVTWARQDSGYAMGRRCGISALADGQTAFVCGYQPSLQKTTDGGAHWDGLPFPAVDEVSAVSFPSGPDTGFAIAQSNARNRVYRTINGGQTWDSMPGTQFADAMQFPGGGETGYAVGLAGTCVRTTDAGANWTSLARWVPSTGQTTALMDLDFPGGEATGFAVGEWGAFLRTDDGGRNWERPCVFDSAVCFWWAVEFLPGGTTGFLAGTAGPGNGVVLRTSDGGVSWDTVLTGYDAQFSDLEFPLGDDTGYAVERLDRAVWKTTDGGDSWVRYVTPARGYLYAVDFPTPATGYAAGENGAVVKTIDAGETWSDVSGLASEDLYDVEFPAGPDTGWVCGSYGCIVRTNDGGATWDWQNVPTQLALWSICFPAGTGLGFCSGEGVMITTTDGGVTWIGNTSLTTQNLWSMQFPLNAGTGYAVGSGGTILKTGFGGGIAETMNDERRTMNDGPTVVRGALFLQEARGEKREARSELLDVSGRKVLALRPGPNDVSRLAPGVYFVMRKGSRSQGFEDSCEKVLIAR